MIYINTVKKYNYDNSWISFILIDISNKNLLSFLYQSDIKKVCITKISSINSYLREAIKIK
jgi:hypothetical protein